MDNTQSPEPIKKSSWKFWSSSPEAPKDTYDEYDMHLEKARFLDIIDNPERLTARQKKWRRFTSSLSNATNGAVQGAMIGGMVGSMFGFVVGVYTAMQTRRLISIPLSMIVSGGTFGFIMGCGSMIRS
jgi:hypothetical protein